MTFSARTTRFKGARIAAKDLKGHGTVWKVLASGRMALISLNKIWATHFQAVQLIATDMDGTLTIAGRFTSDLLQAFERLNQANLEILIVTGRSAGWVSAIANYLPISGAIAENGGLFYTRESQTLLTPIADLKQHRQKLNEMFVQLQAQFPRIEESQDNVFRLTDWTFDIADLTVTELAQMEALCQANGWGFTYSTVQCHIKPILQSKADGLLTVLRSHFPQYSRDQILTVGDSPNDETLFDAEKFPLSIGVANVLHYRDQLTHLPTYVTSAAEGAGFCELAHFLTPYRRD